MREKKLGKIEAVRFGHVGYQSSFLGLALAFSGSGWGVSYSISKSCSLLIDCSKHANWTETDRDQGYAKTMREIDELLIAAKVDSVDKLKGIPVECEFDGMMLQSFRILTEVL